MLLLEVVASSRQRLLQQEPDCSTAVSNPAPVEHRANLWAWSPFLPKNLLFFFTVPVCVCVCECVCVCPQPAHPEGSRLSLESVSLRWRQTINLLSQPDFRVVLLQAWRFGSKEKQPCVKKKQKNKNKKSFHILNIWTDKQQRTPVTPTPWQCSVCDFSMNCLLLLKGVWCVEAFAPKYPQQITYYSFIDQLNRH